MNGQQHLEQARQRGEIDESEPRDPIDRSSRSPQIERLRTAARAVIDTIHSVEQRVMDAGGVKKTCDEINDFELWAMYAAAREALKEGVGECPGCGDTGRVDELVGEWPDSEHRSQPCPDCNLVARL